MKRSQSTPLIGILALTVGLLILKVTFSVVLGYRDYFPPNFSADSCRREAYFFARTNGRFMPISFPGTDYAHPRSNSHQRTISTSVPPLASVAREDSDRTLRGSSPSGLWLAPYARTGQIAAVGFAMLAIVTGLCALFGWRSAMRRRFVEHRRWMWRLFLLLSSAVIVRLVGGFAPVFDVCAVWIYPFTAWASWRR